MKLYNIFILILYTLSRLLSHILRYFYLCELKIVNSYIRRLSLCADRWSRDGISLDSSFSNIFYNGKTWLNKCPGSFVFGCFVFCFRSPDHVKPFLEYFNSQHSSYNFSSGVQIFFFLNVLIDRNNGFSFSVYLKPVSLGYFPCNFDRSLLQCWLVYTVLDRYF